MMSVKRLISLALTVILSEVIVVQIVYAHNPRQSSTFEQIIQTGLIRTVISTSESQFCSKSSVTGDYVGFEPALSVLLAKEAGADVEADFINVSADDIDEALTLLKDQKIDMIVSVSVQKKLASIDTERFSVSKAYYEDPLVLLVHANSNMDYFPSLLGKTIGIENRDYGAKLIKRLIETACIDVNDFNESNFKPLNWRNGVRFNQKDSVSELVELLKNRKISAVLGRRSVLKDFIDEDYKIMGELFYPLEYGVISLKHTDFTHFLDKTIRHFADDGTLDKLLKDNHL